MIIIYCFKKIQSLFQIVMIKIKPDYHEVYYNMGVTYNGLGKYQKAIDAYKEAIKIKPDFHEDPPYCHKPHDNQA
jgi:tetratricopeptide (TPR) repeat protein